MGLVSNSCVHRKHLPVQIGSIVRMKVEIAPSTEVARGESQRCASQPYCLSPGLYHKNDEQYSRRPVKFVAMILLLDYSR